MNKLTNLRGRQTYYGHVLVGFSFLLLTLLTVKTLAPEVSSNAATQKAEQNVGAYTMSMSNDSAATINITPDSSQKVYTTTNNISVLNNCASGATITVKTSKSSNALTRDKVDSDSLRNTIDATSSTSLGNYTWGLALNNSSSYNTVPASGAANGLTVYNESQARTSAYNVPITLGVKTDYNLPSGTYTNDLVYTMAPNSGCLTYSVSWEYDNGTPASGVTYPSSLGWGETIDLAKYEPTRSGYTFGGWSNGSTTFTSSQGEVNVNPNNLNPLTLTAQWNPGIYAITLNNQSATSAGTATIYEKYNTGWYSNNTATTSMTSITKPTKTGYDFGGYYTSTGCSGTQRINASGTITAGNTTYTGTGTLYACWNPGVYAITLNNQSATSAGTATIYEKYNTGWYSNSGATTAITSITKPTRTNYNFKGYYTSTGCSGTQRIDADGKITAGNTTYTGTGTLYACWEAAASDISSISTMQAMTTAICTATAEGTTKSLTDSRDSNSYTVLKAKDGKCWMTDNLRLINKTITNSDSNISAASFTVPNNNWSSSTDSTAKYTNAYTYQTGNTSYGVYYNYAAATAGTISGTSNSTEASYDICPKGWKLPSQTEQAALLSAYGVTDDAAGSTIMRSAPLNFVYSGYIAYNGTSPTNQGTYGYWWSSTASSSTYRYSISIYSSRAYATSSDRRRFGLSVRCVAK